MTTTKPIWVPAAVAAVLVGVCERTIRRRIADNSLPLLQMAGRTRVSIAGLEQNAGQRFTVEEIAQARAVANEILTKKNARRAAAKKEITP